MSFVKICGITTLGDAQAACAAGADAVGFVLASGSPRYISAAAARVIITALPRTAVAVGVVVDAPASGIAALIEAAGARVLQLHGRHSPEAVAQLAIGRRVWRAIRLSPEATQPDLESAARTMRALGRTVDAFLLDTAVGGRDGGTGISFDWRAARTLATHLATGTRLIVAGGLLAGNVAEAIAQSGAWGVDVSSGVETAPGRKDPDKMREFIAAARAAFAERTRTATTR